MPKAPPPSSPKETSTKDILARVHKAVASHYHTIAQEFENFDTLKSNTVSRDEFRSICTRHVQILTDEQVRGRPLTPSSCQSQQVSVALFLFLMFKVISHSPFSFPPPFFLFLSPSSTNSP